MQALGIDIKKYDQLLTSIEKVIQTNKTDAVKSVNSRIKWAYWEVGRLLRNFVVNENLKSGQKSQMLKIIAATLSLHYRDISGRYFFELLEKYFVKFPDHGDVPEELLWSHLELLINIDDTAEFDFYLNQAVEQRWTPRQLKKSIKKSVFHQTAISKEVAINKTKAKRKAFFKDTNIAKFIGFYQKPVKRSDIKANLTENILKLLLNPDMGMCLCARNYEFKFLKETKTIDILFYHRILKAFVLTRTLIGDAGYQDISDMNTLLNHFKKEMNTSGDNLPVGIILSANKDEINIDYAIGEISKQDFINKYKIYLPNKKILDENIEALYS